MRDRTRALGQLLGIAAAIIAWLGWFEIAPALGFPTIGPAAMLNRLFLPHSEPGAALGWVLMVVGLVVVAALYALVTARGWVSPGPLSGVLLGVAAWAFAGLVLMVIIGHLSQPAPAPPAPPGPPLPTTPDPMHATLLMLHLGALAPVEALIAWLLFGTVVGATALSVGQEEASERVPPHGVSRIAPASGLLALIVAAMLGVWILGTPATPAGGQESSRAGARVLASGPAKSLPDGPAFVSIIELPQAPGATLGPHAHVPGFAYVLQGRETISFLGRQTLELDEGEGGFMDALAIHSHENRNRVAAAALAIGLLAIGLALAVVSVSRIPSKRSAMMGLSTLLVVAGAVALWNPWANDWFFIGVRPEAARGGVMPLPNASRVFESPILEGVWPGPYIETLRIITVPAGDQTGIEQEPGPDTLLVLVGHGAIQINDDTAVTLDPSQAALAQQGASVRISNSGDEPLSVLSFSVIGSGASK